ncbi:response regulator transcription factor [Kitasatospora sp. NBC_01266]|uniref:response regulator transcription factor n=1 Tax=Kitasatospora sp. NBC_01266 TaxID=2903572 RepID=UPI002E35E6E7|nr:response regulator transcription factor [Kitasatospora sp. NBC_01266]
MSADAAPPAPLRVIVADDQASVREGLVLLLDTLPDIVVVASAADGQQAVRLVGQHRPDAILLDLNMPVMNGIEATRRLTAEYPQTAVVVLTTYADDASVLDALRAGARSYLTKDADRTDIARALHAAAGGLAVLDPRVQAALLAAGGQRPAPAAPAEARQQSERQQSDRRQEAPRPAQLPDGLTQREAEILHLVAEGLTNPEIAARLYLSNNTIKTHINRIFAKTGSRDRAAAIGYAHRHDLA